MPKLYAQTVIEHPTVYGPDGEPVPGADHVYQPGDEVPSNLPGLDELKAGSEDAGPSVDASKPEPPEPPAAPTVDIQEAERQ